ncbi:hypothetical protein AVEN_90093-1 [Araneus ventricosus]|uniref:CRAL/TRIO N-terminal domain-containing protein n=1 Tax=Araneus ventricosus TaxID=182803 RepID=A0A4Y2R9T5_ARAVE|nr:hypothetical protein AVEN_90093-1 [Araneus ventricosus]
MDKESNGQVFYPLHMDHVPEYFYQKALSELNETPETREVELNKLKDLLSADKLTTGIEFEEDFLQQFLRQRKYNSLKAFQCLQKYLNFRRSHSSIFQSIPDEHFKRSPSTELLSVLPYRCPDGCAIILCELGKWNPNDLSLEYLKRGAMASFLQPLRCPMTQITGYKIIHDFKDTFKHIRYCTPQNVLLIYNAAFELLSLISSKSNNVGSESISGKSSSISSISDLSSVIIKLTNSARL